MSFSPIHHHSHISRILRNTLKDKKLWRPMVILAVIIPLTVLLCYWCHTSNSLALTSFTYLAVFNIGNVLTYIVSLTITRHTPNTQYSYGFERANVLSVFSLTVFLILSGIILMKQSFERMFDVPDINTSSLSYGLVVGLIIHCTVLFFIDNKPLAHASEIATPNWLQNILSDLGQGVCGVSPPLGRLLLYRVNPFSLLIIGCSLSVIVAKIFIDMDDLHYADVAAAIFNGTIICSTMLPLTIYTSKILLLVSPDHILPLIDKSLREASTLDGVLEIKNEHFWTIDFGVYAGSLQVRVRRDANDQDVLMKVSSCLSSQLHDLTIQVVKDDWNIPLSIQSPTPPTSISSDTKKLTMVTRPQETPIRPQQS